MNKDKKYKSKTLQESSVSEPTMAYQSYQKRMIPGVCTIQELNTFLDKAEMRYEKGEYISHEEAMKKIEAW